EWHQPAGAEQPQLASRLHYDAPSPRYGNLENAQSRLSWGEDAAGEVHFGYDVRGRRTDQIRRWHDGTEHATWTEFDAADRPVRRGFPDKTYLATEYDTRGMISSVAGIVKSASWTPWGGLDSITFGNGVVDRREYDSRLRVTRMAAEDGAGN